MYKIEKGSERLRLQDTWTNPVSRENNPVGFCEKCLGELVSTAYYRSEAGWQVAARCKECGSTILMRYSQSWEWQGDGDVEVVTGPSSTGISSQPRERLETVFSPAELRAMELCEKGEPYVRQNLSRARAKYEKFERLFGVRIDI